MSEQVNNLSEDQKKEMISQIEELVKNTRELVPAIRASMSNLTEVKPLFNYLETVEVPEVINTESAGILAAFVKAVSEMSSAVASEGITDNQKAYLFACLICRVRVIAIVARKTNLVFQNEDSLHQALLELAGGYFALYVSINPQQAQNNPMSIAASPILSAFSRLWDNVFPEYTLRNSVNNPEQENKES